MKRKTALVTGASGFLGGHVVLQLLKAGYHVRGTVRNLDRSAQVIKTMQAHGADTGKLSFVKLDLTKDDGWAQAMDGIDYLVHTASPFFTRIPKHEDELLVPAIEGTRRAISSALAADVKRIVLTSSVASVAYGHGGNPEKPLDESDWTNTDGSGVIAYTKSKTLAEREAWKLVDEAGRHDDLTVINPGFIMGPLLDDDLGTSGDIIHKFLSGKFPGSPRTYFCMIDVRDVAELHVLAINDKNAFGHRVFAGNASIGLGDAAKMLAEEFPEYKRKLPTRILPDFIVKLVALYDTDTKAVVSSLGHRYELETDLAQSMLARSLRDDEEAICAMAKSIIDQKLI